MLPWTAFSILVDEPEFKVPCRDATNPKGRQYSTKSNLADDEESLTDSVDYDSDTSMASTAVRETVNVYLRLKPTAADIPDVYDFIEEQNVVRLREIQSHRSYKFTSILNQEMDQQTVYESCVRPLLEDPFASQGAVFASYGVSNSGKTYTILGEKDAGLVPRALTQIFTEYGNQIASYPCIKIVNDQISVLNDEQVNQEINASMDFLMESRRLHKGKLIYDTWKKDTIRSEHDFKPKENSGMAKPIYIWISFLEIYNDKIIDLFQLASLNAKGNAKSKPQSPPLHIISNNGNPYVLRLTWLSVSKIEDALELLQHGLRSVNFAATNLNAHSSRSHTIFTINMISEYGDDYEFTSFKFCDLAGAERSSKTGNGGDRLKETGGINTSLLVLGRCLEAVQHNQKAGLNKKNEKNIPFRDSKITTLLQSSLRGRENFVMIVNLLPTIECFEENKNVLHFGSIASEIIVRKNEPRKFSQKSTRYSYFLQQALNSPKVNTSSMLE